MEKPKRDISDERRGRRILNRFVPRNQNNITFNKEVEDVITNKNPIIKLY